MVPAGWHMKRRELVHPNSALREWTRGLSFTLVMGKTQVATLVVLHLSKDLYQPVGYNHRASRLFVPAVRGLEERGLVRHHPDALAKGQPRPVLGRFWEVTQAGEHVVALLQATGIYGELEREFAACDRRHRKEKMAVGMAIARIYE